MTLYSLMLPDREIVLASSSITRLSLLKSAGIVCKTMSPNVDERAIAAELSIIGAGPKKVAEVLAREKSLSVSGVAENQLVLGADQTLEIDSLLLSKPASEKEAIEHLRLMSGRSHFLHSALSFTMNHVVLFESCSTAKLTMRQLSDEFILAYVHATGEAVTQSVGAYQIERLGIHLFESIEGDHSTILGLSLLPVLKYLRSESYIAS